jgi:cytidylate kinase
MKEIITIDGPSGSGKSTVAKLLAGKLGYAYLDTGALYRAVAWIMNEKHIDPGDDQSLKSFLKKLDITFSSDRILVNGQDVTAMIRTPEIGELSSKISAIPTVRECLYTIQREIGLRGKVVIEGRDIGTVIFPEAENKFFLDASFEERGRRRFNELKKANPPITLDETINGIKKRDKRDSSRHAAPLKKTDDMTYIDTTALTLDEVAAKIMDSLRTP